MLYRFAVIALLAFVTGCATTPGTPRSFTRTSSPGWASVEVREGVDYDRAWATVAGILVRQFDLSFADKEIGYMRTDWLYSWSGVYQPDYRVRVVAKFTDDRRKLEVKTEAQRQVGSVWITGVDTRLLSTLKTDLMGTIARTTR